MFNVNRYAKWIYIAMGLILLVGVTGWFSGGKNGNLIFSSAITLIIIILGIGFLLEKLPELRHGREKVYQMRKEEQEREYQQIKQESELWESLTKQQRKDLCERLGISLRYSKSSLIRIPIKERKSLIYGLHVEFGKTETKDSWGSQSGIPTYYEILGIDKNATGAEIKDAFRKKILAWGPDKKKGMPDADEYTKILYEARDVLLDKEKRRQYDSTLSN